jgi:hypothetical protein
MRPQKTDLVQKKACVHAGFNEKPVRGELQENANPEDRRHLIIGWILRDDKKNPHLNLCYK